MQIGQLQWLYASSDCTASSDTVVARATVVVFLPAEPGEARELRRRFPLMGHGRQPKRRPLEVHPSREVAPHRVNAVL